MRGGTEVQDEEDDNEVVVGAAPVEVRGLKAAAGWCSGDPSPLPILPFTPSLFSFPGSEIHKQRKNKHNIMSKASDSL